jgi:hypothetical protein
MWVQDFPLGPHSPEGVDLEFVSTLRDFLTHILPKSVHFEKELELQLSDYEFRGVGIRLVCSIPGTWKGN